MRLLLVEDDKNLGKATAEGLREAYSADWVRTAEDAKEAIATTTYQLILLDINLPGMSGTSFLTDLRKSNNQVPVLLLTAKDGVRNKVDGLNAGADDYLVKPFDLDELLARCAALIRRSAGKGTPTIRHNHIVYEPASGHLEYKNNVILLSSLEGKIFDILIRNIGRPVSKDKIMENIYDCHQNKSKATQLKFISHHYAEKWTKTLLKTSAAWGI